MAETKRIPEVREEEMVGGADVVEHDERRRRAAKDLEELERVAVRHGQVSEASGANLNRRRRHPGGRGAGPVVGAAVSA